MKLAFVSNYLNHHQLYLCNHLYERCEEFYFIATGKVTTERLNMGYEDMNLRYPYVIRMYENSYQKKLAKEIIKTFDVVIFGACSPKLIELRMRMNKLSFIYTERFLKKGIWYRHIPTIRKKIKDRVAKYQDRNLFVLCASAYSSYDLYLCGFRNKCYKWGYFTEVPVVSKEELMGKKDKSRNNILWVGRLINGKRTKDILLMSKKLMSHNINFNINIIGSGSYDKHLKVLTKLLGLSGKVHFLGSMPPESVKRYMEIANIFIFSGNFKEGWGAVINEAMSNGCAVVVSHAAGSAPYLIEHGKNGLIYQSGNISDLYNKVHKLLADTKLQYAYGLSAYDTMAGLWNPKAAAERLIELSENLLYGKQIWFRNGPCSKAYIIREDWYPIEVL